MDNAINKLQEGLNFIQSIIPNVVETEVKPFGNSSHIILPKEHEGKKATVIIKEK